MTMPQITINTHRTQNRKIKCRKKFLKKILWKGSQSACPSVGGGAPTLAALGHFKAV